MSRLRFLTAGESHGPALLGILEGLPAGLPLLASDIDRDLARRQQGYGRGGRMRIEQDEAEILSGVRFGATLGSPLGLLVHNRDWANWTERMRVGPGGPDPRPVRVPPGRLPGWPVPPECGRGAMARPAPLSAFTNGSNAPRARSNARSSGL